MKKIFFSFLLIYSYFLYGEDCPSPPQILSETSKINQLANDVAKVTLKSSDDPRVQISSTTLFLNTNKLNTKIEGKDIAPYLEKLTPFCLNQKLAKELRSAACLRVSGLYALVAKAQTSAQDGQEAMKNLKEAIKVDPNNKEALESQAFGIRSIMEQSWLVRKIVVSKLKIDIKEEAKKALYDLEKANLTDSKQYIQLKKAIESY